MEGNYRKLDNRLANKPELEGAFSTMDKILSSLDNRHEYKIQKKFIHGRNLESRKIRTLGPS